MRQHFGFRAAPLHALALAAAATACVMNIAGPDAPSAPAPFIGTYDLLALSLSNEKPITPPRVTGVLVLTSNTYKLTVRLQSPDSTASDSGTYMVSGSHWTQVSAGFPLRSEGTVTLANDTLTVNVATASIPVTNVWKKRAQSGQ